jgi:beta-aspartyl-peptidase (threonine type)
MPVTIIVHGGAGTLTPERLEITQEGCKEAVLIGWQILQRGGSALDAVEAAVRALEDNPNFNAGVGSCLTAEGNIEMDAGIMEGHTLQVGAVAAVELIKNPIGLARKVLEGPHVLLIGPGAQEFAREHAISACTFEELWTQRQHDNWLKARAEQDNSAEPRYHRREIARLAARPTRDQRGKSTEDEPEKKHGTVGAVAIDEEGRLAAATSTGGIHNKYPGRVGDSPLVGCGFYADDNAAISCTGYGEDFIRLMIAKRAADFVARGSVAREAAEAAIAFLGAKASGTGGLILVDRHANVGFAWNSEHMVHAYISSGMQEPVTGV